jgi:tripartite-type tricarboxylate transporter receptor subunit TctC
VNIGVQAVEWEQAMKRFDRRRFVTYAAGVLAAVAARTPVAQPAVDLKSIQILVPTPPGTQPDLIARWLVEPIARRAGVAGAVHNRPGAAGAIAADAVLNAAPETGSLLLGGLDHVAYSHLNSNRRPLDPFSDFVPVGAVNRDTWLIVTAGDASFRSLSALVEAARARGRFSYASNGEGSTAHLLSTRLCKALGVDAQHVPYRDSYLPDLIAGRIHFAVAPTPAMLGHVRSGRVHAIAALTDERIALLDSVPSVRELGWDSQVFYGGLFLFASAALRGNAARLNAWLTEVQREPEVAARYRDAGIEPTPLSLEQTHRAVTDRLRTIDAMRLEVFGKTRSSSVGPDRIGS